MGLPIDTPVDRKVRPATEMVSRSARPGPGGESGDILARETRPSHVNGDLFRQPRGAAAWGSSTPGPFSMRSRGHRNTG